MTFSGDLADYPLAELLFFLSANRRSGWLTIQSSHAEVRFAFSQGKLVMASSDHDEDRLGQRLIADASISAVQLETALVIQRRRSPAEALGSTLVRLDYVLPEDVQRAVRAQAVDLIFQILIHPPCRFYFERGLPDVHQIEMDNSIERDVLDAIRRADEWSSRQLWSSPVRLNVETSPDMLIAVIKDDWPVIEAMMDGAMCLNEIADATGWSRLVAHDSLRRLQAREIIFVDTSPQHPELPVDAAMLSSVHTNGLVMAHE